MFEIRGEVRILRLVNLNKENNDRYKVVLSKEEWKKILLGISHQIKDIILIIVVGLIIFSYLLLSALFSWLISLFNSRELIRFYVIILVATVLPALLMYLKSFKTALKPFHFRGMVIDVVEKKIYLKNKTFSFKEKDTLVFYLEKNEEKNKNTLIRDNKSKKDKSAIDWVYYVKKKAFYKLSNQKLSEKGFVDNSFEEFIIPPVEIRYIVDFNLILGNEGLLGLWRQIAELLGVVFEEKIEFEKEILLQPRNDAFPPKTSIDSSIGQELSLNENREKDQKMREILVFLREKLGGKDHSVATFFDSTDFGEYLLFREELTGIRMLSTGFELRFWKDYSDFPDKEQIVDKKSVFKKLIRITMFGILVFISFFMLGVSVNNMILKTCFYFAVIFFYIFVITSELKDIITHGSSNRVLSRITYLLEPSSAFMLGLSVIFTGIFEKNLALKILFLFLGVTIFIILFFFIFDSLNDFSCPWDLPIDRYLYRIVFSFKDSMLEEEYGFCVSRTHWQAPASKVRSLALLKTAGSSVGSGDFLLAIKIDEDYVVLPLPRLEEDKIREIFSFLQEVFNTLLTAFYTVNNTETTK